MKGMRIVDLGLLLDDQTLVIADFHIGYEEALNKQGVLVPRFQFTDIMERLAGIFSRLREEGVALARIVVDGDIKHEFGTISEQEWRETLKILDFLTQHCSEVILVKGNHDTILGPIAGKREVLVVDDYLTESGVLITHGHRIPGAAALRKARAIVIGHEHPAVALRDDVRIERFKCFLCGRWKGKRQVVIPSFCLVTEGTDVLSEKLLSPFLNDIRNYRVIVPGEAIHERSGKRSPLQSYYPFGTIASMLKRGP